MNKPLKMTNESLIWSK